MIGHLLHRLGGDLGKARIARALHRLQIGMHERRIEQLPYHGHGEVAVELLHQQQIGIAVLVAQVGKVILAAALAFDLAGILIVEPRLPDQVEREVGERDILLQHRRLARPLR